MTLCALSDVKTLLDISDETQDNKLNLLIKQVSAKIQAYLGYKLARATYTEEVHAVSGRQVLYVNNRPIQSVTSVTNNGVEITDYKLLPEYTRFGGIYLGSGWTGPVYVRGLTSDPVSGFYDIKVTYVAGYYLPGDDNYEEDGEESLPYGISQVCTDMVISRYQINSTGSQAVKSHSEGGISDTFKDTTDTEESMMSANLAEYVASGIA